MRVSGLGVVSKALTQQNKILLRFSRVFVYLFIFKEL